RILFFAGYSGGAPSRAAGFALTFFPSVLMLILIIYNVTLKLYA
ncbi:MAG: MAPEG family protein, partial [Proteobacteria bacterium]|nr:MAPEG family protein [Pseudomonadota bacterium]